MSSGKHTSEEALAAETTVGTNTLVIPGVKGVEKRARHKVRWPDHGRRRDEESACNTTNRETDQLGRHNHHPLVGKVVRLAIENTLDGDNIGRVCRAGTDASHDGDKHLIKRH